MLNSKSWEAQLIISFEPRILVGPLRFVSYSEAPKIGCAKMMMEQPVKLAEARIVEPLLSKQGLRTEEVVD